MNSDPNQQSYNLIGFSSLHAVATVTVTKGRGRGPLANEEELLRHIDGNLACTCTVSVHVYMTESLATHTRQYVITVHMNCKWNT